MTKPTLLFCWNFQDHVSAWADWGGYARPGPLHPLDERERTTGAVYLLKTPEALSADPVVQELIRQDCNRTAMLAGNTLAKMIEDADGKPLSQKCCEDLCEIIRGAM